MEKGQKVDRLSFTRRFLDRMKNPPEYVDEELPTKTVKIFSRNKSPGTLLDPAVYTDGTPVIVGSIQFTGSHYDFAPGSYSLRVFRRSVYVGSHATYKTTRAEWKLRHSREGTIDTIPFFIGTRVTEQSHKVIDASLLGAPMRPIYSLGPGTIWTYFHKIQGTLRVYSNLEGVF